MYVVLMVVQLEAWGWVEDHIPSSAPLSIDHALPC